MTGLKKSITKEKKESKCKKNNNTMDCYSKMCFSHTF